MILSSKIISFSIHIESFSDSMVVISVTQHGLFIQKVSSVENVCWFLHYLVELFVVIAFELIPLRDY
jgi:hypothetical protein